MELDALAADAAVLRLRLARLAGVSTTRRLAGMLGEQLHRRSPVIAQRLTRLETVVGVSLRFVRLRQVSPAHSAQKIPFSACRSSTRNIPRGLCSKKWLDQAGFDARKIKTCHLHLPCRTRTTSPNQVDARL